MDAATLQYSWPGELHSLQATLKAAGHLARFAVTSFYLFLPSVLLSSFLFGHGAAYWAIFLGTLLSVGLFTEPYYSLLVRKDDVVPLALFLATCVGITEVTEALRRVLDRTTRAEQENALLLQELEHRTKNDLHMVASVLGLQANSHADPAVQAAPEARLAGFRSLPMRTIVSNGGIRLPW